MPSAGSMRRPGELEVAAVVWNQARPEQANGQPLLLWFGPIEQTIEEHEVASRLE